jgi:hypothetical protein
MSHRNFGIPPRDPDNGDPPFHWVDDHFEVASPDKEGVLIVGLVWGLVTTGLFIGAMWILFEIFC